MPKPPPDLAALLEQVRRVTDQAWSQPFFDDPGGAIAPFRGYARAGEFAGEVASRSLSRQYFTAPPGFESAGFAERARGTVTLRRTQSLDEPLFVLAGAMTFVGPSGRLFGNVGDVVWYPAPDPEPLRVVEVAADVLGEPGNLDAYAAPDGSLTDPTTGGPDLRALDLQALSQGRAGTKATLTLGGAYPQLTTSGVAPTWVPSDVGLHLLISSATNPANIGRLLRIVSWSASETPGADGYYPRTVELDDTPQPALVSAALLDDGGVFTDYTGAAQAGTANVVELLPLAPAVADAFYFGGDTRWSLLDVEITTRRFGDATLAWEWWDGALWQPAVDLVDGTDAFQVEGISRVSHTPQIGWSTLTVSGRTAYWLRARVSAFVSQAQQPLAGRLVVYTPDPLAAEVTAGQVGWIVKDYRDLGLEIVSMVAPTGGRDSDLQLKLDERKVRQRPFESIDALRRRAARFADVVTPEAIEWEVNRILEPLGLAGQVCDLGKGWTGLFCDVPTEFAPGVVGAWDLYAPGDAFPTDPSFVPLSELEARWHFFVKVPKSGLGEFGAAWDDGPPSFFAPAFGTFLGSAFDYAFCDGYPVIAASAYAAVWERVNEAKAGGIGFTLIAGDVPVCP
jgi:hypothetical protein